MTTLKTNTDNKLIAEFMGYPTNNYWWHHPTPEIPNGLPMSLNENTCKFQTSYDWLMPVVEKIETIQLPSPSMIPVSVQIKGSSCRIFKGEWNDDTEGFISVVSYSDDDERFSKIEVTFSAVVEFIKWYNQQNKTTSNGKS